MNTIGPYITGNFGLRDDDDAENVVVGMFWASKFNPYRVELRIHLLGKAYVYADARDKLHQALEEPVFFGGVEMHPAPQYPGELLVKFPDDPRLFRGADKFITSFLAGTAELAAAGEEALAPDWTQANAFFFGDQQP